MLMPQFRRLSAWCWLAPPAVWQRLASSARVLLQNPVVIASVSVAISRERNDVK